MRDPNRIDKFCDKLAELWHKVPDWRFGQLMENLYLSIPNSADIFYTEDEELFAFFENYMKEIVKNGR